MPINLEQEQVAFRRMTVGQLQARYTELCGEVPRSRNRAYLQRRILWRLQARAEGGLSERSLRRAEEIADVADVRTTPPKRGNGRDELAGRITLARPAIHVPVATDPRLPAPGTAIARKYKGRSLTVNVLADGFEYLGDKFTSLSAVAKAITGSHVNGFRFFGLEARS